jgi:enoyl-CoA hydratase/carnithine racemase
MAGSQILDYSVKEHVATITLNRPEKLNAINLAMLGDLFEAFESAHADDNVWIVVLMGNGPSFCVGHDLEMSVAKVKPGRTTDDLYIYQREIFRPLIAGIHGHCLAQGAGLALGCDIRIAGESTKIGWPQVKRGISSISGPSVLAHVVPLGRAMELLFTGDMIDASEAQKLGIVNRIVPDDQVPAAVEEMIGRILGAAPPAVRGMKEAVMRGLPLRLEDRVRVASYVSLKVALTNDAKEGLRAFAEKRPPVWSGF